MRQRFSQRLVRRTSARVSIAIFCVAILLSGFATAMTFQGSPDQKVSPYSIEFENLRASSKAVCQPYEKLNSLERQDMSGFGQGWSGSTQLFWRCQLEYPTPFHPFQGLINIGEKVKQPHIPPHLTVPFNVPKAGTYELVLHYTTAPDYWAFYVALDGQQVGDRIEGQSQTVAPKARSLGQYKLSGGGHELEVRVHDNQASNLQKYYVGLDRLELREPAPIKKPSLPTNVRKPGT